MGYDSHAVLFVGIEADDAIERTTVTEEVTKYDEDTGKPHKKTVSKLKVTLFGKPVGDAADWGDYGDLEEELDTSNKAFGAKLQVCAPNPESDEQLIGHSLDQIGTGEVSSVKALAVDQIEAELRQVRTELRGLGYSGPDPRVFLVFQESF